MSGDAVRPAHTRPRRRRARRVRGEGQGGPPATSRRSRAASPTSSAAATRTASRSSSPRTRMPSTRQAPEFCVKRVTVDLQTDDEAARSTSRSTTATGSRYDPRRSASRSFRTTPTSSVGAADLLLFEPGTVGWDGASPHFDTEDGVTLVRVTLVRGRHPSTPLTPDVAQGYQVLCPHRRRPVPHPEEGHLGHGGVPDRVRGPPRRGRHRLHDRGLARHPVQRHQGQVRRRRRHRLRHQGQERHHHATTTTGSCTSDPTA